MHAYIPTQPNPTQPNPTQPNQTKPNQQPNPTQPNPPTHQPTYIHTDRQTDIYKFFPSAFCDFRRAQMEVGEKLGWKSIGPVFPKW